MSIQHPPAHPRCRCWLAPVTGGKPVTQPGQQLSIYKDGGYRPINQFLRKGYVDADELSSDTAERLQEIIPQLDAAIARQRIPEPVVTFRGAGGTRRELGEIGDVMVDQGYLSTSVNENFARGWVSNTFIEIHLPAGQEAVWMESGLSLGTEAEILLPRGLPLRIVDKKYELKGFGAGDSFSTLDEAIEAKISQSGYNQDYLQSLDAAERQLFADKHIRVKYVVTPVTE